MDNSQVKKLVEVTEPDEANAYLNTGRWVFIGDAAGQGSTGAPYHLYSLGWLGPADPEHPEEDKSEFPVPPAQYGWNVE